MISHRVSSSRSESLMGTIIAFVVISYLMEINVVNGLQSSVLADLKQIDRVSASSHIPNKVKRAQEVVMFGNQQNKLSDHNYVRADKRDLPNLPVTVDDQSHADKDEVEEPIVMASVDQVPVYPQLSALRGRYYYEQPDVYDGAFYEEKQNSNMMKRSPAKRSDRIFRSFSDDESNRIKRDSQLSQMNPEELLSLLAMWEEQQQKHRKHSSPSSSLSSWSSPRNDRLEYEPYSADILNELEANDNLSNEEWLNGPEPVHHLKVKPRFYPPYNNFIPSRQTRNYKNVHNQNKNRAHSNMQWEHGLPQKRYL